MLSMYVTSRVCNAILLSIVEMPPKRKISTVEDRKTPEKRTKRAATRTQNDNAKETSNMDKKRGDTLTTSTNDKRDADVTASEIERDKQGKLVFADFPGFKPNLSPKEVLQAGSFGGTYFRAIRSSVTGQQHSDAWKEFPVDWFDGLDIKKLVASSTYRTDVNTYKVKSGGSLEMWESSGWIHKQDPFGWFQWYCRFYLGRRTEDDTRQVGRWMKCAGDKGRWRNNLITKVVRAGCTYDDPTVSPVVRQTLQHWGYTLTKDDFDAYAKKVKI